MLSSLDVTYVHLEENFIDFISSLRNFINLFLFDTVMNVEIEDEKSK